MMPVSVWWWVMADVLVIAGAAAIAALLGGDPLATGAVTFGIVVLVNQNRTLQLEIDRAGAVALALRVMANRMDPEEEEPDPLGDDADQLDCEGRQHPS